jgi:hypothetical protein
VVTEAPALARADWAWMTACLPDADRGCPTGEQSAPIGCGRFGAGSRLARTVKPQNETYCSVASQVVRPVAGWGLLPPREAPPAPRRKHDCAHGTPSALDAACFIELPR